MLVLSRKPGERINVYFRTCAEHGNEGCRCAGAGVTLQLILTLTAVRMTPGAVKLGLDAHPAIEFLREEIDPLARAVPPVPGGDAPPPTA